MRKIYTVVFALMVLLSVPMSAMAAEITITGSNFGPSVVPDAPAPAPALAPAVGGTASSAGYAAIEAPVCHRGQMSDDCE